MQFLRLVALAGVSIALLSTQPATADAPKDDVVGAGENPKKTPASAPKRVIHSIEFAANQREPFDGAITLKLAGGAKRSMITYYWGGKCKGTKLSAARIAILLDAMDKGHAVEIPSKPIRFHKRIYMCVRSFRIIKT